MQRFLIVAQSEVTAAALEAVRALYCSTSTIGSEMAPAAIIHNRGLTNEAAAYKALVQRINSAMNLGEGFTHLHDVVVLVDSVNPSKLSAISEGSHWDQLVAMLVLTFPEVRWIFGVLQERQEPQAQDNDTKHVPFPRDQHSLAAAFAQTPRPALLDPTGLREWVRQNTNSALVGIGVGNRDHPFLAQRPTMAAAVDEETDYAWMHGYAAYRYGFRTDVITSWGLMQSRFVPRNGEQCHPYTLLLEDMRLAFADKPAKTHLSRLRESTEYKAYGSGRAHHCPLLANQRDTSRWRFLITTGQMGSDETLVRANRAYLDERPQGGGDVLLKPVGGIADLWKKTGLFQDLRKDGRPGNAPGYRWPPARHDYGDFRDDGHGSPGKLLLVASMLLERAEMIQKETYSAERLIHGAVLSGDAAEILAGRTPTLTLAAILLKHEFEVRAECAFVGAGYHFDLRPRLTELHNEITSVTGRFHKEVRRVSALSAETSVLNRLVFVFREAHQKEEEQICLNRLRRLNRKLSAPKSLNPIAWAAHGILAYGEWLLGSFPRLILMTLLWIFVLFNAASWACPLVYGGSLVARFSHMLGLFLGGTSLPCDNAVLQIISWIGAALGVFHLGVLISYLYSLISRS